MDDKYFEDARAMFMTEGWKTFLAEVEQAIASITVDSLSTSEEFHQARGRLGALRQIAGYENAMFAAEAMQEADSAEDI